MTDASVDEQVTRTLDCQATERTDGYLHHAREVSSTPRNGLMNQGVLDHGLLDHGLLDHGLLDHGLLGWGSNEALGIPLGGLSGVTLARLHLVLVSVDDDDDDDGGMLSRLLTCCEIVEIVWGQWGWGTLESNLAVLESPFLERTTDDVGLDERFA